MLVLEKLLPALNEGRAARSVKLTPEEIAVVRPLFLLTIKPTMYVANVEDHGFENNPLLDAVREFAASEHSPVVAVCAKPEAAIADLADEDKEMFLADMGMTEPGLDRVIRAGYDLLGLQTYFTAGVKEVRAWTIHKGDTAPQAAGVIHTDLSAALLRPRSLATTTTSSSAASRAPRLPASCVLRARTMSWSMATSCTSALTCKDDAYV